MYEVYRHDDGWIFGPYQLALSALLDRRLLECKTGIRWYVRVSR